jgi:WD40 repeat protein
METRERPATKAIVSVGQQGLVVRSAALVARGLRDLTRDSNWIVKKIFAGHTSSLAISGMGHVCFVSRQFQRGGQFRSGDFGQRVLLYDMEMNIPMIALSVPNEAAVGTQDLSGAFAWSPTTRFLVAAWGGWQPTLHSFDLHGKMFLGVFGDFASIPRCLVWSPNEKYFVEACSGGKKASLRLWRVRDDGMSAKGPLSGQPTSELGVPGWLERQTYESEFGEEGAFGGYGRTVFSPNEKTLASVVEIYGDWADDSIALLAVPTLKKQNAFQAQGHITDLCWTHDGRKIIYCAAGQAYRLEVETMNFEPLPFGAELCVCHPHLPLCICYSSWLKNSAKGRLFLVDLNRMEVFDEYAAEGVAILTWNGDGSKAYAATQNGMAYIYEPTLI